MNCPDCGGPMWDNRETKKSPKQPDYKCKNRQCDKAVWLEKRGAASNGNGNGATHAAPAPSSAVRRPLGPLYFECLEVAKRIVSKQLEKPTNEEILSATATLFIAASRDGTPLMPAKPVPPPPPPEPVYADENYGDARNLPF